MEERSRFLWIDLKQSFFNGLSAFKTLNMCESDLTPNPSPEGEGSPKRNKSEIDYFEPLHKDADPVLFRYAREGRKRGTQTEHILWELLRNRGFLNLKFRRQHPVDKYVADFYCHEKSLIIEIDGGIHQRPEMVQYDKARDQKFASLNIKVLRVNNEEVLNDITSVLLKIKSIVS